jgi:hypothetical protein
MMSPDRISDRPAGEPESRATRLRHRRRSVVAALLTLLVFSIGGACGLVWYHFNRLQNGLDRVYREALANGDADAAYDSADEAFRQKYGRDEFRAFLPACVPPVPWRKVTATEFIRTIHHDQEYAVLEIEVTESDRTFVYGIYCKVAENEQLRLIGILPRMGAAIPSDVRHVLSDERLPPDWFDD